MAENKLSFNLKKLTDAKTLCDNMSTWLLTEKDQLATSINSLETDWNTPAGRAFRQTMDSTWIAKVDQYAYLTKLISELLSKAITQYGYVEHEAKQLSSVIPEN